MFLAFFPSTDQIYRTQVFVQFHDFLVKFSLNIQNYPTKYNILVTEVTLKSQKYVKIAAASCAFEQQASAAGRLEHAQQFPGQDSVTQ